jgi:uncharacterized protein
MLLGLSRIIDCPGGVEPFELSLDLSDFVFGACRPATEPVCAKGEVRNIAGVLELSGTVTTTLHPVCDRCATPFTRAAAYPLHAILTADPDGGDPEDPWVFALKDDSADLDDIVTTCFVLNMDSKFLCKEDCKGLCFRCGANLNEGPCSCRPETDPRFAALGKLLDKK